ncbi:MAG: Usg family protein [Pseudomonadota bacterium]
MANTDLSRQLDGYRLTTAEILYHLPDHPTLLQSYIWQDLDLAPKFPVLKGFLGFWEDNLEGRLHSVRVGSGALIAPAKASYRSLELSLH